MSLDILNCVLLLKLRMQIGRGRSNEILPMFSRRKYENVTPASVKLLVFPERS